MKKLIRNIKFNHFQLNSFIFLINKMHPGEKIIGKNLKINIYFLYDFKTKLSKKNIIYKFP